MIGYKKIIAVLVLVPLLLSGCGIKSRIKRADKKFAIGEYYDAAEIYRSCYPRVSNKKERPLKARIAFNQGECYRILNNTKAANAYKNAIRNKYQDSIVYLHYAQVLHYQGQYKEAEKNYAIYLEAHPDSYEARAGQHACQNVGEWKKQFSRYKISKAAEFNHRRSSNFSPMFIGNDANAIMFVSNRQETSAKKKMKRPSAITGAQTFNLYSARKNAAGQWEEIELPDGLYSESEDSDEQQNDSTGGGKRTGQAELGPCTATSDGRTLYFTYSCPQNGLDLGAKIYTSSRASGEWSEAQEVKIFNDSSITVAHPTLCQTGDTMYFVSDAPYGQGGKDIWMAVLEDGQWIDPQNMGKDINTEGNEMFPFIHPDGTLYFASTGHPGYGGLDLFKAERDSTVTDSVKWIVYNLGTPFNSNGDDFGITFSGNSQNGYFSSNRGQKKALDEIYRFTLPEMVFMVEGTVTDMNGDALSDAVIRLVGDDGTNTKLQVRRDGTYKIKLKKDANYVMLGSARGHLNQKQALNTLGLNDSKTYTQDFALAPISKPITMDNIFYEFGKWDLTPQSETGLQTLVKLLNDNPNITIELSAHTDLVGDDASNLTLSKKRAESVVSYLIKAGIETERLTPVGYGETKPVVADKALHAKYPFIPVGQELNEIFITGLKQQSEQDICNQINRRTEFKVLKTTYKLY